MTIQVATTIVLGCMNAIALVWFFRIESPSQRASLIRHYIAPLSLFYVLLGGLTLEVDGLVAALRIALCVFAPVLLVLAWERPKLRRRGPK
jgi:hypothetical protein